MTKSNPKEAKRAEAEQLPVALVRQLAAELATDVGQTEETLNALMVLADELEQHYRDAHHVEFVAGEIKKALLIYTHEFEQAERLYCERVRREAVSRENS